MFCVLIDLKIQARNTCYVPETQTIFGWTLRGMNTKMELFFLLLVFVIKHQT